MTLMWTDRDLASELSFIPDPDAPRFRITGATSAVKATSLPLLDALPVLASLPMAGSERASASVAAWSLAAKLALELVARERLVPRIRRRADGRAEARIAVVISGQDDAERATAIAKAMRAASCVKDRAVGGSADVRLREFLDLSADGLVRAAVARPSPGSAVITGRRDKARARTWEDRFLQALTGPDPCFELADARDRKRLLQIERWSATVLRPEPGRPRVGFRLDFLGDVEGEAAFVLHFFLVGHDDPSLIVDTALLAPSARKSPQVANALRQHLPRALACLRAALLMAGRIFPPIERALADRFPAGVELDAIEARDLLCVAAEALSDAGYAIVIPPELLDARERRPRLRMRIGGSAASTKAGLGGFSIGEVLDFRWEAALGDTPLTTAELSALAALKTPLLRFRGQWVVVDPAVLAELRRRVDAGPSKIPKAKAVAAALAGASGFSRSLAALPGTRPRLACGHGRARPGRLSGR